MSSLHFRGRALVAAALLTLISTGCDGRKYATVAGRVVDGGEPVRPKPNGDPAALTFQCLEPRLSIYCVIDANGGFVAYAPDGKKGLPPGKYKVGFTYGETDSKRTGTDFTPEKSPIELDLEPGEAANLTVDVAKRTLTK